ncbi:MAG TPA: hypothetical protein PKA64_17210, partial [Myxococcota bacterium]|nr:hypothetical protein [Myxococcota bacterium]
LDVVAPRAGVYRARAVAVQDDGCGREVESTVWIGADDGTPVGPIPMSAEAAVIDLASPTPSTRVFIDGASTCRGTSAGNVDVFVRADRGALFGVLAGASGPLVTLDAAGSASFLLDATGVPSGGRGTVYADVSSGAAQGSVAVELAGDRAPPYVWYQSPKGYVDGPVSSVVIGFSEPLDAGSVVIDAFEVRVGGALEPPGALSWSGARSEVRIDLAQPITPITQAISVSIKDGYLMDRSGNALACNLGRDNRCYFGVISGTPAPMNPVSSCEVSAAAFRPDGVDGLGVEADRVRLTWPGAGNPAWWVIDVISDAGLRVQREYLLPTTAPESWSWDGRDATGKVVEPGTWTLRVAAEDSQGSQSAACERQVDLVQRGPL